MEKQYYKTIILLILLLGLACGEKENKSPVINKITASSTNVSKYEKVTLSIDVIDPDNDTLNYSWSANGGTFDSYTKKSVIWTAPYIISTCKIKCTVNDNKEHSTSSEIEIIVSNRKPEIVGPIKASYSKLPVEGKVKLSIEATDLDNDTIEYLWSANAGSFDNTTRTSAIWTAPNKPDTYTIYCKISDIYDTISDSTIITVIDNIINIPSDFSYIQSAIDYVKDTAPPDNIIIKIKVAPGIYNEDINLIDNITLQGAGADSTIISGNGTTSVIKNGTYYSPPMKNITINNLSITHGLIGISLSYCSNVIISSCKIYGNTGKGMSISSSLVELESTNIFNNAGEGIYISYGSQMNISNCVIASNTEAGIETYYYSENLILNLSNTKIISNNGTGLNLDGSIVTILNCNISKNLGNGIYSWSSNLTLSNSIINSNSSNGIYLGSSHGNINFFTINNNAYEIKSEDSFLEVKNTIIANNKASYGIYSDNSPTTVSYTNFFNNKTHSNDSTLLKGKGIILSDPLFVNSTDFHLQETSPAKIASETGGEIGVYGNNGNPPLE